MKNLTIKILSILVMLMFISPVLAQTGVGKLSGKVIDAATREAFDWCQHYYIKYRSRCCN